MCILSNVMDCIYECLGVFVHMDCGGDIIVRMCPCSYISESNEMAAPALIECVFNCVFWYF